MFVSVVFGIWWECAGGVQVIDGFRFIAKNSIIKPFIRHFKPSIHKDLYSLVYAHQPL